MRLLIAKGMRGGGLRFVICAGGIAVSTMLVLVLLAAYRSVSAGVDDLIGQSRVALWVAPRGTDNLIRSSGLLDRQALQQLRGIAGIARVEPLIRGFVTARSGGTRLTLLGMLVRNAGAFGGRPLLTIGRMPRLASEVALDRSAAHILQTGLGETISVNGSSARVVGITSRTNLLATQFIFGALPEESPFDLTGPSFALIHLRPDADAESVRRSISKHLTAVEVMPRQSFVANNQREVGAGFRPMLLLISLLGVGSSALLVAFLIESVVETRRGELATLLATGAAPQVIAAGLAIHAAMLLACGVLAGAAAAHLLAAAIDRIAPVIPLSYSLHDFALAAALLSAAGMAAAIVPLIRLRHIDPLEAFRS